MIAGVHTPIVLAAALPRAGRGLRAWAMVAISRGVIIEPPAFVTNAINAIIERIARRAGA